MANELPTIDQYAKQKAEEEAKVKKILAGPDGAVILAYLARMYDGKLHAQLADGSVDAQATLINIGAREVYVHLRDLRNPQ